MHNFDPELINNINRSLRRIFIDHFQKENISQFGKNSLVLDIGGTKSTKRGTFNIEEYSFKTVYLNVTTDKHPDILADAAQLPFQSNSFDNAICAEVLEHVYDPKKIIEESSRVLKSDGLLMITVPFLIHIHADPEDYGRYTEHFWRKCLNEHGFEIVNLESQGYFWSTIFDMLRMWYKKREANSNRWDFWWLFILRKIILAGRRFSIKTDFNHAKTLRTNLTNFTTGYGIIARKLNQENNSN